MADKEDVVLTSAAGNYCCCCIKKTPKKTPDRVGCVHVTNSVQVRHGAKKAACASAQASLIFINIRQKVDGTLDVYLASRWLSPVELTYIISTGKRLFASS